jgi:hypothetical protein
MSNMEITESTAAQVERFEDFCFRVRGLEGKIESVLARRDHAAVEAVQLAEHEMEDTEQECAEIEARVGRARRGDVEKAEKSHSTPNGDRIQSQGTMKDGWTSQASKAGTDETTNPAPVRPEQQQAVAEALIPIPLTNLLLSPAFDGDSDDFSVISSPKQCADMSMDEQTPSKSSDHSEDDSSDDFLTLLIHRYTDLCYERRTLQGEIEERLEKKKRVAEEKLRCAKIALEATRRKAAEIVATLNEHRRTPSTEARTAVNLDHTSRPLRGPKKTAIPADDRENKGTADAPPQARDNKNLEDKIRPASPPLIIRDKHSTLSFEKVGFLGEVRDIRPNLVAVTPLTISSLLSGWNCTRVRGQRPFRDSLRCQGR